MTYSIISKVSYLKSIFLGDNYNQGDCFFEIRDLNLIDNKDFDIG